MACAPSGAIVRAQFEKWSVNDLEKLRKEWWQGGSPDALAASFKCDRQTIYHKVWRYKFLREKKPWRAKDMSAAAVKKLRKLVAGHASQKDMADALDLDRGQVQRALRYHKIKQTRTKGRRLRGGALTAIELAEMRKMYEAGDAEIYIRDHFKAGCSTVFVIAKRHGWKRPPGWDERRAAATRFNPTSAQLEALKQGWSEWKLAEDFVGDFGVSAVTIGRLARRLELKRPPKEEPACRYNNGDPHTDRNETIRKLWNAGCDAVTLADQFWLGEKQVRRLLSRMRCSGLHVLGGFIRWDYTARDKEIVRLGYRYGCGIPAIVEMTTAREVRQVKWAAKKLGISMHRNAGRQTLRVLAPENMLTAAEMRQLTPPQLVNRLYVRSRRLTEQEGLRCLRDFYNALARLPELKPRKELLRSAIHNGPQWRADSQENSFIQREGRMQRAVNADEIRRILAEQPKRKLPDYWSNTYVGELMIEAYRTLARTPDHQRPRGFRSATHLAIARGLIAGGGPPRRRRATNEELTRMDRIMEWPTRYLTDGPERRALMLWAACKVDGKPIGDTLQANLMTPAEFDALRHAAEKAIAQGLNKDRIAVF